MKRFIFTDKNNLTRGNVYEKKCRPKIGFRSSVYSCVSQDWVWLFKLTQDGVQLPSQETLKEQFQVLNL
jgi:hypothetical protein